MANDAAHQLHVPLIPLERDPERFPAFKAITAAEASQHSTDAAEPSQPSGQASQPQSSAAAKASQFGSSAAAEDDWLVMSELEKFTRRHASLQQALREDLMLQPNQIIAFPHPILRKFIKKHVFFQSVLKQRPKLQRDKLLKIRVATPQQYEKGLGVIFRLSLRSGLFDCEREPTAPEVREHHYGVITR